MTIETLKSITDRYSYTVNASYAIMKNGTVLEYSEIYEMWLKVNLNGSHK
jgi:hypothetical protein